MLHLSSGFSFEPFLHLKSLAKSGRFASGTFTLQGSGKWPYIEGKPSRSSEYIDVRYGSQVQKYNPFPNQKSWSEVKLNPDMHIFSEGGNFLYARYAACASRNVIVVEGCPSIDGL